MAAASSYPHDCMQTAHNNEIEDSESCRRVLVVDDDDALREIYVDALGEAGYDVRAASDGSAALRVMESGWTPCVVFLDLRMPGMNGWELARRIRSNERWKHIRIVVIAAHIQIDREAREIGAAAWLQKPFDLSRLEQHASSLCRG
jgi:CheY-like chemotaxis protein